MLQCHLRGCVPEHLLHQFQVVSHGGNIRRDRRPEPSGGDGFAEVGVEINALADATQLSVAECS